ncbi:MAG: hypothetical protein AAGE80_16550 [Pseudomonadota bacterium]
MTGFAPFGRWSVNSSWEAIKRLDSSQSALMVRCLPVDHLEAAHQVEKLIRDYAPYRILLTGLADRSVPTLEMQARLGPHLREDLSTTRCGRWDFPGALAAMRAVGIPCRLSWNAGRYVCETTYWAALGQSVTEAAFLHLPPLSGSWTTTRLARAVTQVLGQGRARVGGRTRPLPSRTALAWERAARSDPASLT